MSVKYRLSSKDRFENNWVTDFSTEGYTGEVIPVRGYKDTSAVIQYTPMDGEDPFTPIIYSTFSTSLINQGNIDIEELQSAGDRDFTVTVYRNGALYWIGYMVPDKIKMELKSTPNQVSFTAIDGLKLLDGIDFGTFRYDPMGEGVSQSAPLAFIREVLFHSNYLNLRLPITWVCEVLCGEYPDDVYGALAGTPEWGDSGRAFKNYSTDSEGNPTYKSCQYVMEGLLRAFGCRIFQSGGKWNIRRINDVVTGAYTLHEIDTTYDQSGAVPTITTTDVYVNKSINREGDYRFVRNDQNTIMLPPLKSVKATYSQNQAENILPNGSFKAAISGSYITDWALAPAITDVSLVAASDITQRSGYSAEIDFPGAATGEGDETALTLYSEEELSIPFDASILFKTMRLGFTFMTSRYPTTDDGETIDWENDPLQISVKYTARYEDGLRDYYLNEFGYWQYEARGAELGVKFNYMTYEYVTGAGTAIRINKIYFQGSPNIGDVLSIGIKRNLNGSVYDYYTYEVDETTEGQLQVALFNLRDALPSRATGRSVVMQDGVNGYVQYQTDVLYGAPDPSTYKSGNLQDYKRVSITADTAKIGDVVAIQFQSKGNAGNILIPDPGIIDGEPEDTVGHMEFRIYVKRGQKITFDDVYINVEENNDVYKCESTGNRNSKTQDVSLEISSSFSGFMTSNIMTSWAKSGEEYVFTDGKYTGALTGMVANAMMRFRYQPCRVFEGSIYGNNWNFDQIYSIESFLNRKFIPLSATYNTEANEIRLVACECRDDTPTLSTTHYASNDKQLSN